MTPPGVESGLLIWDLTKLAAEGVAKGGIWIVRQGVDYAKKCHWWL